MLETNILLPVVIYGLHQMCASLKKYNEQEILYTTSGHVDKLLQSIQSDKSLVLEEGDYVQFNYHGPRCDLQKFILLLYGTCIPTLGLARCPG